MTDSAAAIVEIVKQKKIPMISSKIIEKITKFELIIKNNNSIHNKILIRFCFIKKKPKRLIENNKIFRYKNQNIIKKSIFFFYPLLLFLIVVHYFLIVLI
jgi:hypothetical protein